jgi:hypothetical protein
MLRAHKRGMFKRQWDVEGDSGPLTTITGGRKESCEFELAGAGYRVERDGSKKFTLHGPQGRVAAAERDTGREWTVRASSGNVKLVRTSMWRSRLEIRQRGSAQGVIRHDGGFKRTYTAEIPADVPSPVAVFTLYLALVLFERAAATAAAASGG